MPTVVALAIDEPGPIQRARDSVGRLEGSAEPYLALSVLDDTNAEEVAREIGRLAAASSALSIGVSGLGIFPGEQPVIYASVLLSDPLLNLHRAVSQGLGAFREAIRPTYRPGNWMPHITLLAREDPNAVPAGIAKLMECPIRGVYRSSAILVVTGPPPVVQNRFALT